MSARSRGARLLFPNSATEYVAIWCGKPKGRGNYKPRIYKLVGVMAKSNSEARRIVERNLEAVNCVMISPLRILKGFC